MIRKFLPLFMVAFSLYAIGCSEDPSSSDEPSMKAEIDGEDWEATQVVGLKSGQTASITGSKSDGTSIGITIANADSLGTFAVASAAGIGLGYSVGSKPYVGISGSVKISSSDSAGVTGTFDFIGVDAAGTDTIEVKDGTFVAHYNI